MATRGRRIPAPNTTQDLVSALNSSTQNFSLQFVGMLSIFAFVLAVVWSTQDRDILFMSSLPLPIVKVDVSLYGFYLVTPFVVMMLHISMSAELNIILRRLAFLNNILSRSQNIPQWNALRAMLSGSPYFNIASGLHSGWFFQVFVRLLFYISFFIFPIFTLLFIQWRAIALHDVTVTRTQQIVIAINLLTVTALFIHYNLTIWRAVRLLFCLLIICILSFCVLTIPISNPPWTERPWVWLPQSALFRDGEAPSWSSIRTLARVFFLSRNLHLRKQIIVPDGYNPNTFFDHLTKDGCIATDAKVREGLIAFSSRDFRFADFSGSIVAGADFGGARTILDDANFDGSAIISSNYGDASLKRASFRAACLTDVNFTESNIESADMSLSTMASSSLNLAKAGRANFSHATIVSSSAVGAHLESSVFNNSLIISFNGRDSYMYGAELVSAKILDADFAGAKAQLISLEGSTLLSVDATRIKARGTQLTGATLTDVDFTDAMLEGSSFDEARFLGVRFVGTRLSACSMRRMKNLIVDTATPHTELIAYSRATKPTVDLRTGEDVYASTLASILAPPTHTGVTFKDDDSTKQLPAFWKSSNARVLPSNGICGTKGNPRSCLGDSEMGISDRARAAFLAWMFCQDTDFVCPLLRLAIGSNRTGFNAFPELAALLQTRASMSVPNCPAMAALNREQVNSCYGASINDLVAQLH